MGAEQGRAVCCLGMFAKHWQPGSVKTRLAADIGAAKAADVYLTFVETLLDRFSEPAKTSDSEGRGSFDPVVVYSPRDRRSEFQELLDKRSRANGNESIWSLEPQSDGDLGTRLEQFFATMFQRGYSQAIAIGTDSPTLPANYLQQAIQLLKWNDVVVGPSEDGGYYLVGARSMEGKADSGSGTFAPKIFDDIEWSSDRVFSQTVELLQSASLTYAVLPSWYDVDTMQELTRLRTELKAMQSTDQTLRRLDARLNSLMGEL